MELRDRLWNTSITPEQFKEDSRDYHHAILEQYRIYVEMADRVSQRRSLTNTFFLSLNTGLFAAYGWMLQGAATSGRGWLVLPLVPIVGQCFAWFYLVRSYRLLNTAKYEVVGALEERLPASPYWRAEWTALGEGKDRAKYWPLTHVEKWIPLLFAVTYICGFLAVVIIK